MVAPRVLLAIEPSSLTGTGAFCLGTNQQGVLPPEQVITGPLFDRLVDELAAANIQFNTTVEKVNVMATKELQRE